MKIRTQLKLYLVSLLILCPGILWAKPVAVETARKVAVNSMNKTIQARALKNRQKAAANKVTEGQATHTHTAKKKDISAYYVFNFSPEGWIIISADDATCPVIAYSDSGTYDANVSNQPPAFIDWMDNVASQITDAASQDLKARPKDASAWKQLSTEPDTFSADLSGLDLAESVDPLIQTHWGQGGDLVYWYWLFGYEGYSKYCPYEFTDWTHSYRQYCPTGCVATAMGQIMKYWQWPPSGNGSHGYDPPTYTCTHECSGFGWRQVNFANQYYNWSDSSMPLNNPSEAIDLLMRDIGVAVDMDYTPSISGAGILTRFKLSTTTSDTKKATWLKGIILQNQTGLRHSRRT
jgi:hypothetical protein